MSWRERFTEAGGREVAMGEVDRVIGRRAGLPVTQAQIDAGLRSANHPTLGEFREVGLCEADARSAAEGLLDGVYLSFEDACLSRTIFDTQRRNRLDEVAMRNVAERYAAGDLHTVAEHEGTEAHLKECGACRAKFGTTKVEGR